MQTYPYYRTNDYDRSVSSILERRGDVLGPNHGPELYKLVAIPLSLAGQMSAITPPAFAKGEEPKVPARNRNTIRTAALGARAHGI